ncbi:hypothetical protein NHX12_001126 [Muraenolepis orangiensis]|uniref:Myelin basic protein n=1 Tax=Muraenolepis orangiensis TaxID=630683 RepID=A0A9Q0E1V5_9TELE|nr:hypothetical protein NHX12_001126 [Muraenolepis orangiensis]
MASASSSAQAAFGLGRKKKSPTFMDQIGNFFGGDKKRKSKGSFRGALSPAPQKSTAASPRKRGQENAVVQFFRTIWTGMASKMGLVGGGAYRRRGVQTEVSRCQALSGQPHFIVYYHSVLQNTMRRGSQKSQSAKGKKGAAGDGTLTKIFKMALRPKASRVHGLPYTTITRGCFLEAKRASRLHTINSACVTLMPGRSMIRQ